MLAPIVLAVATHFSGAVDMTEDEYRLYCGYLDAIEKPEIARYHGKTRDKKVAHLAHVRPKVLMSAVDKGGKYGATCDEIGKKAEADARAVLDGAFPGRISVFKLDYSDPSHVVALVTWLGLDRKKVVEEASTIVASVVEGAKITKTIAVRAVDPAAPDKTADSAMWWEAKITHTQATRIDKSKVADYATTRYLRLFDGCKTVIDGACQVK